MAVTVSPVAVVTAAMVLMMTSWLIRGRPRQFRVIAENSRSSILFHLEVPGVILSFGVS
jgi:ABC-type Fe3+ transport system permease subunit